MNYLWKSTDFDLEADFQMTLKLLTLFLALECLCGALTLPDSTDHWLFYASSEHPNPLEKPL